MQDRRRRNSWERTLVQFQCRMFVASWTGVVRYHGPRPVNRPNNVWVCNHTSMIDYIILTSYSPFAVIMQLHAGWIAFIQTRVLSCLGCLWFNRNEARSFLAPHGCVMQAACWLVEPVLIVLTTKWCEDVSAQACSCLVPFWHATVRAWHATVRAGKNRI